MRRRWRGIRPVRRKTKKRLSSFSNKTNTQSLINDEQAALCTVGTVGSGRGLWVEMKVIRAAWMVFSNNTFPPTQSGDERRDMYYIA